MCFPSYDSSGRRIKFSEYVSTLAINLGSFFVLALLVRVFTST